jgi:hypothetical protein
MAWAGLEQFGWGFGTGLGLATVAVILFLLASWLALRVARDWEHETAARLEVLRREKVDLDFSLPHPPD